MSSYVIPVFPAASRVPPRDALAARLAELAGRFAELSSELAAIDSAVASVSAKADKAVPAASGNLASLDASGNLADSGATPASIKAAAVAEVVANAPAAMDTLKEIADILGSSQESGTVLKRISDLEGGKVDKESGKGLSANDYTAAEKAKLAGIAAGATADTVDPTLAVEGAAADAKATGDALRSGFTEWVCEPPTYNGRDIEVKPFENPMFQRYWRLHYVSDGEVIASIQQSQSPLGDDRLELYFEDVGVTATRHAFPPTKTSQLTNDGAPDGGGTPYATTEHVAEKTALVPEFSDWTYSPHYSDEIYVIWYNGGWYLHGFEESGTPPFSTDPNAVSLAISTPFGEAVATRSLTGYVLGDQTTRPLQPKTELDDVPTANSVNPVKSGGVYSALQGKADMVSGATAGNLASLTETGNLADSGAKPSDFAAKSDLPYALVTPGEWEFSDGGTHTISAPYESYGEWVYELDGHGYISDDAFSTEADALAALSLTFETTEGTITATRASLPGHLLDRAGNRVVVSGDTTLTLPAAVPGLRDFLVRLEISGSTVPTITFAAPTGETITYETDGDEFPVPDEAGAWLYSFTESCVAHKFAVSLKKVNEVAAPQAQGGS